MSGFTTPTLEDLGFVKLDTGKNALWIRPEAITGIQPNEDGGSYLFLHGHQHHDTSKVFVGDNPDTIARRLAEAQSRQPQSYEPTE